ncbi:MAG: esterase-like activity of phytase family protein [Thermoanaerobaculia bacterium]
MRLQFLGAAALDSGRRFEGTVVGGLSGITYDAARNRFYAVSDDPSLRSPARFYTLTMELRDGRLGPGAVEVVAVTGLVDFDGKPFEKLAVDPEGIALAPGGTLWISSEGQVERGIDPFVREFRLDGRAVRELSLPPGFRALPGGRSGPRHNLALESVALSPDGSRLFTATENALVQDGPAADLGVPSPVRLLRFDAASGRLEAAWRYQVEPIPAAPVPPEGFKLNGLVELLALRETTLLALERSYSAGVGNGARLYQVFLDEARESGAVDRLAEAPARDLPPARKELLLDLRQLGVRLDNLEGMTLGPELSDGRRTLVLVSDDNFNHDLQVTQFLAFAVVGEGDSDPVAGGARPAPAPSSPW